MMPLAGDLDGSQVTDAAAAADADATRPVTGATSHALQPRGCSSCKFVCLFSTERGEKNRCAKQNTQCSFHTNVKKTTGIEILQILQYLQRRDSFVTHRQYYKSADCESWRFKKKDYATNSGGQ